ncbi:aspartate aminotransferase family protein [Ferrimicrobium sp.]|uniref:aspartate aminotransferase family protein n=1 Tax=Ferrimicrobium sp. TaxID=2926050 RepID=UPI002610461E|nr:aspartate aminotransferase family protein [Ferrimicrobium sp.]
MGRRPGKQIAGRNLDTEIAIQEGLFLARQSHSYEYYQRALHSLAGGVTSSWQITRPQPIFIDRGVGSKIIDVDGNEYVDLHGGYGAGLAGHAHSAIVNVVQHQVTIGTHFAQPNENAIIVAENLAQRFGLPLWRFTNSGTEATMDAVHLMRAATGRELIIKIEGCYHGHHDSVQVSVAPDGNEVGLIDHPVPVPASSGIPSAITDLTLVATFNDLSSVEYLLNKNPNKIAGLIIEPIMMNAGIIKPEPGYLAGLKQLLVAHGALLTFDEVKSGLAAGPGGATGLYGVRPDLICLAKAIGGGLIVGAVGGTHELMQCVVDGTYEMVGTFNGNPLSMAASRAMLEMVVTPEAYERLETLHRRAVRDISGLITKYGLLAHVVSVGAKGCVTFSATPVRNYRDFLAIDDRFNHLHWLVQLNGGVLLPPWGKTEQWTISVQHSEDDMSLFIDNFAHFAEKVTRVL